MLQGIQLGIGGSRLSFMSMYSSAIERRDLTEYTRCLGHDTGTVVYVKYKWSYTDVRKMYAASTCFDDGSVQIYLSQPCVLWEEVPNTSMILLSPLTIYFITAPKWRYDHVIKLSFPCSTGGTPGSRCVGKILYPYYTYINSVVTKSECSVQLQMERQGIAEACRSDADFLYHLVVNNVSVHLVSSELLP